VARTERRKQIPHQRSPPAAESVDHRLADCARIVVRSGVIQAISCLYESM
jgi:hypothetical protein